MSVNAIKATGLGKQYRIGGAQKQHNRLGDMLVDNLLSPMRKAGKLVRGQASGAAELDEIIWALKDVSFEIERGETVGIIGRNGAGKSTLLKVLSRITEPTEGYADVYGRVGSLLEVGTGFHPELTGRENVFLNGAILGMRRDEIGRKFDEIVAFAELNKFIDTPVKHYSSGMYVRLAFSVAAHLEPEILVVDEVLAVGDVAFQNKCLGKMDSVAKEGRTVLFVSHNMGLIQALCECGILLEQGKVGAQGPISDVVDIYLRSLDVAAMEDVAQREDRFGVGAAKLIGVEISGDQEGSATILRTGYPARFSFRVNALVPKISLTFDLFDHFGQPVTNFTSSRVGPDDVRVKNGELDFVCDIDELLLLPGRYRIDVWIDGDNRIQDAIRSVGVFDVAEGYVDGRPSPPHKLFRVGLPHRWTLPI